MRHIVMRSLYSLIMLVFFAPLMLSAQDERLAHTDDIQQDSGQFIPTVRMLGMTTASDQIEWVVTISNTGTVSGRNVVLSNQLVDALQVDNVQISTGTASINGQSVTIIIPRLPVGETVRFSIITTPLADAVISNTVCARADNFVGEECAFALPLQALPATGETPFWRTRLQWFSLMSLAVSLLMIGGGLIGWRVVHD
jgi:uncharacterized repeat protein (TIGR01451 family)